MMKRDAISPTEAHLRELLSQRILILDGAMGTMIQQYKLTEQDYRGGPGGRFADFCRAGVSWHARAVRQGQQRAADLDPAADHPGNPRAIPGRRRRPDRDQHLRCHHGRAGRLPYGASGL
ncbi:hypothetical protein ACFS07_02040 [Undibacterium arcticum]